MKRKLYNYISEKDRSLLSINFLLAEKIIVPWNSLEVKVHEKKEFSNEYHNADFYCTIFDRHISRYLHNASSIKVVKI